MMSGIRSDQACLFEVGDVVAELATDPEHGLNSSEVEERRRNHGHNEFSEEEQATLIVRYMEQFKEPMILLLLASAAVSVFMKQFDDALSITIAIIIVVTVAFIQEYRSEQSLKELKRLVPPKCHCIRDGRLETFLAKDLVPGDLVKISVGDRVPADIRLVEAVDLSIDESSFTGEPKPARKAITTCKSANHIADRHNIGYMGTLVRCGSGKGIVISIGERSEFGEIFKMMQAEDAPKTPLQNNMDSLGKQLSFYSFCIIGLIVILGWLQGRPIMEMFTIGVSLAVAAIPEGLPIVVTVTLALGVMRMANRKTIVKKLPAVETLGCVNVICCDKTGTLTKNKMTVVELRTSDGVTAAINPHYQYVMNGQTLSKDEPYPASLQRLLEVAVHNNNAQYIESGMDGTATECALLTCANSLGVHPELTRLQEWPFSSETKTMVVKCADHNGKLIYFLKGAMERVLSKCNHYHYHGSGVTLDSATYAYFLTQSEELGRRGLRVLALAFGTDGQHYTYIGMTAITDPPRVGVAEAIGCLKQCGVRLKMITGDAKETATAIAQQLGIYSPSDLVLSGYDIESMDSGQLRDIIDRVSVFYRTSPKHKTTIVNALKDIGLITGMTGDGVNDAIALKAANIGIAMGATGTDVSKEAADVILVDDQFTSLIAAIEEGRGIFHNIRNFVSFQLSTSIAALTLIAMSTLFGLPNPLNAMQILWINILMDGPPAQSLGVEPVDHDVIKQPPRKVKDHIITPKVIMNVIISAAIIVAGTLFIFWWEMSDNQITPRDTTMTFTCFVFFDMFNALGCRSATKSIIDVGFFTNRVFLLAVGGSILGQMLVIYFPPLQAVFQTEALFVSDIVLLLSLTSSVFVASEIRKFLSRKNANALMPCSDVV